MSASEEELCLIDAGILSMLNMPIGYHLQVLNLHANRVTRIENLVKASNLLHLDLSSNAISTIEGLDNVPHLRSLNLSCNKIRRVRGLGKLRELVKINLSYNVIDDLNGFSEMNGSAFNIKSIDLSGNVLNSIEHVKRCLIGCTSLHSLILAQDGETRPNKLCNIKGYVGKLFSALPMLCNINNRDRNGQFIVSKTSVADIPALDQFAEYFYSSSSETACDSLTKASNTTLNIYKQQQRVQDGLVQCDSECVAGLNSKVNENRLSELEHQISRLLDREHATMTDKHKTAQSIQRRTNDDEQDEEENNEHELADEPPVISAAQHATIEHKVADYSSDDYVGISSKPRALRKPTVMKRRITKPAVSNPSKTSCKSTSHLKSEVVQVIRESATRSQQPHVDSVDISHRAELQATYVQLMQQLEVEKERRWKAEQAAKKLADSVRVNVGRLKEEQDLHVTSEDTLKHLRQTLAEEREIRLRVQSEKEQLEEQVQELTETLNNETSIHDELRAIIKQKEESARSVDQEYMKQENVLTRRAQESQLKAAALTRELELVKVQLENTKSKLQQMQELLASREQEHRRDLEGRVVVGSREFQEQLRVELSKQEQTHREVVEGLRRECEAAGRRYSELEDEFRIALHSEADRFHQLKATHNVLKTESERNSVALAALESKDSEARSVIADLNSLVRELKGRIVEMTRSKQEQSAESRERVQQLELNLEEARHRLVQCELMKKERVKMAAELAARESLIEGMKSEKRLWGDELAKQSSSLAQDRGRLESKVETLQTEVASLKKQLERETDSVRIKTRVIEDQNDTVRKLKEGLVERDGQIKHLREQVLTNKRLADEQLNCEIEENKKLAEQLNREQLRKTELKSEISHLKDDLLEAETMARKLKDRLKAFEELDEQVELMKASWSERESKLLSECSEAKQAAATACEQLKAADDSFRTLLDAKELGHQMQLEELEREKQSEIEKALNRVEEVENEMRVLLCETEHAKRSTEERMKRLTFAFTELQQDITS